MPTAQERLAARARRISAIRRRVVAGVLATFALAWGVVAYEGSMGAETTTTAQVSTTTAATATATPTATATASTRSSSSSDDGSTLTTSQS